MKNVSFYLKMLVLLLLISCDRELILTNDFNFNFTSNFPNGNTQFASNNLSINLLIENIGESDNNFKIKYISDFDGVLSFSTGTVIPMNEYIDVSEGFINLYYNSSIVGSQNISFYCIDASGNEKIIPLSVIFNSPEFDFTQNFNYSSTNSNNCIHEVFIENEDVTSDSYFLKYELINMNWIQDPGILENSPIFYSGLGSSPIVLPENSFVDITSSIVNIPSLGKKRINILFAYSGYSQFQMKLTIKNSFGIEKILIFDHNGVFPFYNHVDFLLKYKRGYSIGSNNYMTYTFCYNIPSVSGAVLTNFKVLRSLNTENNYIDVYSSSTPPNYNTVTNKGWYVHQYMTYDDPFIVYHKYRIILTYSDGTIHWVDKGINYDLNIQIGFATAITNFINNACL